MFMFKDLTIPLPLDPKLPTLSCPVLVILTQLALMTRDTAGVDLMTRGTAGGPISRQAPARPAGTSCQAVEVLAVLNTFHLQHSSVLFTSLFSGLGKFCLQPLAKPHPHFKLLQILTSKKQCQVNTPGSNYCSLNPSDVLSDLVIVYLGPAGVD